MPSLSDLRLFPGFGNVPDQQLQWLLDRAETDDFAPGEVLYAAHAPIDVMRFLLEGEISIVSQADDDLLTYVAPAVLGVLPYSRLTEATNPLVADTAVRTLTLHRRHLRDLTATCYELTQALVQQMTDRVRNFAHQAQQEEKMASLGRLSAGLAHELNNPVAAIVRNADALKNHLRATPDRFKQIMALRLTDQQTDTLNEWLFDKLDSKAKPLPLLERSNLEDDLTDWLGQHNVPDPTDLASTLATHRFSETDLAYILGEVGAANLPGVLGWVNSNLVTEKLVVDIADASGRMATLVASIKAYTHMDRGGGKEIVDLTEGIQSTLTLLGHDIRAKNATVTVQIPTGLPPLLGWPGELNQVWTNLIHNAIDALPPRAGTLLIAATPDRDQFIRISFTDNGTGIPEAIQSKIFEPFFTTKPVGKGTGLGLDIVQGIVKHHNGSLTLTSQPGQTVFTVCLPLGT